MLTNDKSRIDDELSKFKKETELTVNHLDTKNRLLTEALNKRNEDIKTLENSQEDLINLIEKLDEKWK